MNSKISSKTAGEVLYKLYGISAKPIELPGEVDFIQHHKTRSKLRDARKHPLHFQDYVIPVVQGKDGKPHVSAYMTPKRYNQIKRKFHKMSLRASKKEIAAALGVSVHTARHHVEHVLRQLDVTRSEVPGVASRLTAASSP